MLTTASLAVSRQILHSNALFVLDSSSLSLVEVLLDVLAVAISFMERRKVLTASLFTEMNHSHAQFGILKVARFAVGNISAGQTI